MMTKRELIDLFEDILEGELLYHLNIIRPPRRLVKRFSRYTGGYSAGYETIKNYNSVFVYTMFTDIGLDYYIREFTEKLDNALSATEPNYMSTNNYDVLRKELAYYAGLGLIAENSLLFSYKFGFNCKIDMLATSINFDVDSYFQPEHLSPDYTMQYCRDCNLCAETCKALSGYRLVDPKWCDCHLDENNPEKLCRLCVEKCPYSNELAHEIYKSGYPRQKRWGRVSAGGEYRSW